MIGNVGFVCTSKALNDGCPSEYCTITMMNKVPPLFLPLHCFCNFQLDIVAPATHWHAVGRGIGGEQEVPMSTMERHAQMPLNMNF